MSFNYEQSIWGKGEANLKWSDPTAFRLEQALLAIKELPEGSKIMELGCGAGQFIRAVKKLRPDLECHGCDISRQALELAKQTNDGVVYTLSEESKLPYEDGALDAVLIFDVLEHVQDPGAILDEVRRVLKPEGILYAFVPCEGDSTSLWHFLDQFHMKRDLTKKYAGHINYFSRKSLLQLFADHAFSLVRIRYSEHVLGQMLGVVAFHLMDRAAMRQGVGQINNEAYFETRKGGIVQYIKDIVNSMVYLESEIFQQVSSPNVHVVVRKV